MQFYHLDTLTMSTFVEVLLLPQLFFSSSHENVSHLHTQKKNAHTFHRMVIKFTSFHCHTLCLVDMILNAVLYRTHGTHEVQDFNYTDR